MMQKYVWCIDMLRDKGKVYVCFDRRVIVMRFWRQSAGMKCLVLRSVKVIDL
jgi:hypothetical protein